MCTDDIVGNNVIYDDGFDEREEYSVKKDDFYLDQR